MFSHYYTSFELAHALRLSKATRIFVQPQFLPLVQKAAQDVGFPNDHIYIFEGRINGRRNFSEMIHQVRQNSVPRLAVRPAGKDTLAYLMFSSGTTGVPKGQW
jgi:acyl-CoA synthetase (AMP-forming)/AMP-acid ligase II